MKNTLHFTFLRALMILAFGLVWGNSNGQIIISQVYEGASNNKWVEITNVGGAAVNLSTPLQYKLAQWNASGSAGNISISGNPTTTINLTGTLSSGASYLVKNTSSSATVPHNPMPTGDISNNTVAGFNGNDGLAIISGTNTIIDAFGTGINNTDVSYHRKSNVLAASATFNLAEWTTKTLTEIAAATDVQTEYIGVHIFGGASTTWDGTAWTNGTPTALVDATIDSNYSTGAATPQGAFMAKSLTVNSGFTFTITTGTSVTVENAIINNAGESNFTVESGANLIQNTAASNTGAITVLRNSAPIVRLDHTLWSSPVASQNLYNFSPATLTNRFYTYNTSSNTYVTTGLTSASTFVPGKGFAVRAPNTYQTSPALAWEGVFKGVPNNGDVTFLLSTDASGFNLVGNPYPSAINATTFISNVNNPAINGTLYFYAHSLVMDAQGNFPAGTNYSTWNSTGHTLATASSVIPNGIIQVGQGFIVKATQAANVNFKNAMRSSDVANQFFRTSNAYTTTSEVEKHRIWLNLTNQEGTAFNQILIGYVAGATEGFDRNFDGLSFGNTGSSLSTKIDGSEYAIQARSLPFQASDIVPVTFKATAAGNYTITLSDMDGLFSTTQDVFLKDNTAGTTHDLKSGAYTFASAVGTFDNRFEVVYQSTLSTPESVFNSNSIVAFKRANVLNVETKNIEMASIKIYDVQGRLVYTKSNINTNTVQLTDLQVQNGVLLLQVTTTEGSTATIKVIN